jgi:LacI family transcriptional regulator
MGFRQDQMANRPTIHDVAREAGVSSATVDRVLNGREKVREETARKVYEAARLIGYHAAPLIGQRVQADLPRLRLGLVLHKERQAFYQQFKAEAERAVTQAAGVRATLQVAFASSQSPKGFHRAYGGNGGRVDAIAATAVTHPEVTEAVVRLNARGIPCFSLLNDFAQGVRQNYLGLNNLKVGRIAAHMIATASHHAGKIAVFVGGYRWHGHELRETGVRSYFREHAPQFQILDTLINLETRQLTYEATLDLLGTPPGPARHLLCGRRDGGRDRRRARGAGAGRGGAGRERTDPGKPRGADRPTCDHGHRHTLAPAVR